MQLHALSLEEAVKMKPQERVKQDPREQALIRRITRRGYPLRISEYGFEMLHSWSAARRCRLAVEAMVSNALLPEAHRYKAAHVWIQYCSVRGLLVAVALHEATYSPAHRSRVMEQILDKHRIKLSNAEQELWYAIGAGKQYSWNEIVRTVKVGRYRPMPPRNCPELFDACRWLMTDPTPENLAGLVIELLNEPQLPTMPNLRWQMVRTVLEEGGPAIELFSDCFPLFCQEIVAVLTDERHCRRWGENAKERSCYLKKLFEMAQFFAARLDQLPIDTRDALAVRLVRFHETWTWSIAETLCRVPATWDDLPDFLLDDAMESSNSAQRWDWEGEVSGLVYKKGREGIASVLPLVPDCVVAEVVKRLAGKWSDLGYRPKDRDVQLQLIGRMQSNPDTFKEALSATVQTGKCNAEFLLDYLRAVGIEQAKGDLASWLANAPDGCCPDKLVKQLATDCIVPFGLSAGGLLADHLDLFLKSSYQLHSEDIAREDQIERLLSSPPEYLGQPRKFPPLALWHNQQWRELLLSCGIASTTVVSSLLAAAPAPRDKGLDWLEEVFALACESRPELRRALCKIAWDPDHNAPPLARSFLVQGKRLEWAENPSHLMRRYTKQCWCWFIEMEQQTADAFLTAEEQRNPFFNNALERKSGSESLPPPQNWRRLFVDAADQARLKKWLIANQRWIYQRNWLEWVYYFGFGSDASVRRAVRSCLETCGVDLAKTAIDILKGVPKEA